VNRRGNILDALLVIGIIGILAIGMLLFVYIEKKLNTGITSSLTGQDNTDTALTVANNVDSQLPWTIDFFVIMMMFGLPLLTMILAFFNNIHPAFFWASLGFTMLIIVAATWYAQVWQNFTSTADVGLTASVYLPMTNWIMNNYVAYAVFCVFVLIVGVYAKSKSANGGGGYGY
jgi:hypothetical protein